MFSGPVAYTAVDWTAPLELHKIALANKYTPNTVPMDTDCYCLDLVSVHAEAQGPWSSLYRVDNHRGVSRTGPVYVQVGGQ